MLAGLPIALLAPAVASAFKHVTLDPEPGQPPPVGVQVMHTGVQGTDAHQKPASRPARSP